MCITGRPQEDDVAAAPSSGDGGEQGEFQPLDDEGVRAYLAAIPHLAGRLGGSAPDWKVRRAPALKTCSARS